MSLLWGNPVFNGINQAVGNTIDKVGTALNLPEFGISEAVAAGPTQNSGRVGVLGTSIGQTRPTSSPSPAPASIVPVPGVNYTPQNASYGGSSGQTNQQKWEAAGHSGTAPVGYNGENTDPYAALKNEISSAWDSYINSLGGLQSGIQDQRTAQENIANTQFQQGQDTINSQKASSLRDIGSNIRNAFQAGNIYLGARGAGDSSAANQYQFALSKEASKQTGQLNEFVNTQINNLQAQHDTAINQIASWFAEQQNQIKQLVANGQLSKAQDINNLSKDILNQAIAAKNQIQQNAEARYNALVEWAANNSSNIGQLSKNIASIPQAIGAPQVDSSGNFVVPAGYGGGGDNNQQSLFQNLSWL